MSRFSVAGSIVAVAAVVFVSAGNAFSEEWLSGTGKLYVDPESTKVGIGMDDPQTPLVVAAPLDASALFQNAITGYSYTDGLYVGMWQGEGWILNQEDTQLNIGSGGKVRITSGGGGGITLNPTGARMEMYVPHGETAIHFKSGAWRWNIERDMGKLIFRDDGFGRDVLTLQNQVGYVGIGTRDPQSELAVNGTITAQEVIVTMSGWPDHVFDEEYSLPALDSVESYIEENKHLPDIPSAKEVEKNGLAMSEMLAKQMQKIEELTLYLIEMKKENAEMKSRIAALEQGE